MKKQALIILSLLLGMSLKSQAAGAGGGHGLGFGAIIMSPSQDDLNNVIGTINSSQSKSIDKLGTAYEFNTYYQYRFSGTMFAMQFRPSYFMQSSTGSGYETKLTGFTFFPMLRLYPLENAFIHFFLQAGVGYGKMSGEMSGNSTSVSWSGDAYGTLFGLGSEFCFTPAHCVSVEGNLRYLPIQRNMVTAVNGSPSGFSQTSNNQELEANSTDVATTFSGIQGAVSYVLHF